MTGARRVALFFTPDLAPAFLDAAFFAGALPALIFLVPAVTSAGGGGALAAPSFEAAPFVCSDFGFFATMLVVVVRDRSLSGRLFASGFSKRLHPQMVCTYGARVRHFLFRWAATTIAVMVASAFLRGIRYDTTGSLLGAALLLGILNAFVRPVLLILSAPLILVSLGFFILIVNALMLFWVPSFVPGFHVDGFGTAFWGAIVIGLVSWMLSAFFRGSDGRVHVLTHHSQIKQVQGRVIEPK